MSHEAMATAPDGSTVVYRDLNGNGVMDPYEDRTLPTSARVADLVSQMTLEEKVGLMFHPGIAANDDGTFSEVRSAPASTEELVSERLISHFTAHHLPAPREIARWNNSLQALAEKTRLGIPVTMSSDPRHGSLEIEGQTFRANHFSAWPEPIGLGALGDAETVREFADMARQEYVAVGIRASLHPTADLATEPRWARQYTTFGQDSELAATLVTAYLAGFQGDKLGHHSVACMTKHFPGGGPQLDGEDPHFPYGREQVYPGNMLEYHLVPFIAAIAAGTSAMMPYYGMPVGLKIDGEDVEQIGFSYNKQIVTGLLREKLGYTGVICTDWALVTESVRGDKSLPARAWGAEDLTRKERVARIVEAGCDQFGGEECTDLLIELVNEGRITEARITESAVRLLTVKFDLGLFDDPYLDEDAAAQIVGRSDFVEAGFRAQARSVAVLENNGILPISVGSRIYLENATLKALPTGYLLAESPEAADLIVMTIPAPHEPRDTYFLESGFQAGSLEYDQSVVDRVRELEAIAPVVVAVTLTRPSLVGQVTPMRGALVATFGISDDALLAALTGVIPPEARLPFDIPESTDAVRASQPDVPGGTAAPTYRVGHRAELTVSRARSGGVDE